MRHKIIYKLPIPNLKNRFDFFVHISKHFLSFFGMLF